MDIGLCHLATFGLATISTNVALSEFVKYYTIQCRCWKQFPTLFKVTVSSGGSSKIKNKRVPEKHLFLPYWLPQSLWLCRSQQIVENSERDGDTRPLYLSPEKSICRSRSNSQNRMWNNRLIPNLERSAYISPMLI